MLTVTRCQSNRREVPILLQNSFAFSVNGDFVALMGFAKEAVDDGGGSITTKGNFSIHSVLKTPFLATTRSATLLSFLIFHGCIPSWNHFIQR